MKFGSATFGALVRPRVLLKNISSNKDSVYYTREQQAQALEQQTHKSVKELFQDIHLGDTSLDLSNCYVGRVKSLIINFNTLGTANYKFEKVNYSQMKAVEEKCDYWRVSGVGLEFYTGMCLDANGILQPVNLWPETEEWFYHPDDVLLMHDIVNFESCRELDLIISKKTSGMVLDVRTMNKPQFYRTNSWTSKNVTVLSGQHGRRVKLLPFRKFKISRLNG